MRISKTVFKEYTRCPRVSALDDLYMKKMGSKSMFDDDAEIERRELLGEMFDLENGDDLIHPEDAQVNILLPYYSDLEAYAMKVAEKEFGSGIIYNRDTKKQKSFAYTENGNEYICYLDGYQEKETRVNVFEVKATSDKKFFGVGSKVKGEFISLFERFGNIVYVKQNGCDLPDEKYQSNYNKLYDRYNEAGKYIFDLAIERYYIENSIKKLKEYSEKDFKYYLVVLNSEYIYDGSLDDFGNRLYNTDKSGNELVLFFDFTEVVKNWEKIIKEYQRELLDNLAKMNGNPTPVGKFCDRKKKNQCAFFNVCWKRFLESGSLLEYIGNHNGFKHDDEKEETLDLLNDGYLKLDSIPKEWLSKPINIVQRDCYDNNIEYIDKTRIIKGISAIKYPIYHLDFESFPCPLPRFRGEKPYTQSVFQFSLHIEKKRGMCDIEKDHLQFLSLDQSDHREELIQKMIEYIDLSKGGTVLVYNDNFEKTRIKEFSVMFPKYAKELLNINDHVYDLMWLLKGNERFYTSLGFNMKDEMIENYYNNDLHGSYSIKKVLPIFSSLTYKGMPIGNGNEAIVAYATYDKLSDDDLQELQANLIKYCCQDTWAMVVILWKLIEKVL